MSRLLFIALFLLSSLLDSSRFRAEDEKPSKGAPSVETRKEKTAAFDYDRQLLQEAGIGTDSKALMKYLGKLSPKELEPVDFPALFLQLGDKSFEKREEASKRLAAFDLIPSTLVWDALYSSDKEVVRRARDLAEKQAKNSNWFLPLAAVRQLAKEKPPGTLEVLLRYLPFATWEDLIEEIWYAIDGLAMQNGKIEMALLASLHDPCAARRAVAGCIIARAGDTNQKRDANKLLSDADALVRLRVAQGNLAGGGKAGIPTLVELLNHRSTEFSWQAEELLHWFAGEEAPKETVGAGTQRERADCVAAWRRWLLGFPANEKDAQSKRKHRRPRLLLVSEESARFDMTYGQIPRSRIWLCGCDSVKRWELADLQDNLIGFELLSPNRLLLAQRFRSLGQTFPNYKVQLIDLGGKLHFDERLTGVCYFHAWPNQMISILDFDNLVMLSGTGAEVSRMSLEKWGYPKLFSHYANCLLFISESRLATPRHSLHQMDLSDRRIVNSFALPKEQIKFLSSTTQGKLLVGCGGQGTIRVFGLDGIPIHCPATVASNTPPQECGEGEIIITENRGRLARLTIRSSNGVVIWEAYTPTDRIYQIATCYRLLGFGYFSKRE